MFLSLKHSHNYLLIYITVFIDRLLGALQKKTFDVISALMGMNWDFLRSEMSQQKVTLWCYSRAGRRPLLYAVKRAVLFAVLVFISLFAKR